LSESEEEEEVDEQSGARQLLQIGAN